MMKGLAVLTSGGDAPGMNAAIRAVVRTAVAEGLDVYGVRNGYTGLIGGNFIRLGRRDVGGILQQGGTILGTTRCSELVTEEGQEKAMNQMKTRALQHLVVIGGNGSQAGAYALSQRGLSVVGVASTIDNDLPGSDITIGAATAIDVALESIDRLRTTASSLHRGFLVEVMGRNCGYLAAMAGIAGGAEAIVIPEAPSEPEAVAMELRDAYARGKSHAIVVVAEGAKYDAAALAKYFAEHHARLGFELRVCKLGHVQRGGSPGVGDRMLATRLGAAATDALQAGEHGVLVGVVDGRLVRTPLRDVVGRTKPLDTSLLELARVLAQ